MHYTVYILYSHAFDTFYIGHTQDLKDRLFRHNNSGTKSTKFAKDWDLVYQEEYKSRSEAAAREAYIKSRKSRKFILELIASYG